MRVALLGAGGVGRTLGEAWRRAGHEMAYGLRQPERHAELLGAVGVLAALDGAKAVVLAVPGTTGATTCATTASADP